MLDLKQTKKSLTAYRDLMVKEIKRSLKDKKKISSGELYDSIQGTPIVEDVNSISFGIEMADYGEFIDKGVSGKKKKYNTPYKYTNKMPPPNKLDKWIVRKGLAPRDTKGRFTGRSISSVGFAKSISFLIARSIYMNGIKPSLFFTKPFRKYTQDLPIVIAEALRIDADKFFEVTIKTNR